MGPNKSLKNIYINCVARLLLYLLLRWCNIWGHEIRKLKGNASDNLFHCCSILLSDPSLVFLPQSFFFSIVPDVTLKVNIAYIFSSCSFFSLVLVYFNPKNRLLLLSTSSIVCLLFHWLIFWGRILFVLKFIEHFGQKIWSAYLSNLWNLQKFFVI